MSTQRFPLPVIEAFATQTRRTVITFLVEQAQADGSAGRQRQWHSLGEMADATGLSREALRQELSAGNQVLYLLELGLVTVRDPDANIRHYQLAQSPPAQLLYENDHVLSALAGLFEFTARQELVSFFLDEAGDEAYTQYALNEELGISYEALDDHLDVLCELGIIEATEGSRSTEYQLAESPLTGFVLELNERLAEAFQS
jgi:DNA-binding transcriptional ArsR family regulator